MSRSREEGSALIMAIFVLVLLTGMGVALLFLSQQEVRMGQAGLRAKAAFYLAETGVEDARMTLLATNTDRSFDNELAAAAGADGVIDFDVDTLLPTYDSAGRLTGLAGYDDDVPLRNLRQIVGDGGASGWYAAFLTNDPIEGRTKMADANDRVMLTAVGAGDEQSLEVVQAIIEPRHFLPEVPPAALTMLGPSPKYDNGNSNAQSHVGEDCGVPGGPYAPIVGTASSGATAMVKAGMNRPEYFSSGPFTEIDTVANLTDPADPIVKASGQGTIAPGWLDCPGLKAMVETLAGAANYYCNTDLQSCAIPSTTAPDEIVFIDGDLTNTPAGSFTGILVVTGQLTYRGNTGWDGIILVVGEGNLLRNGGGTGTPSGAAVIANIDPSPAGPRADKSDWCTTAPDGFLPPTYLTTGGGNSTFRWCTDYIDDANSVRNYRVVEFLQR